MSLAEAHIFGARGDGATDDSLAFATLGSVARGAGPVIALALVLAALVAVVRSLFVQKASQREVLAWVVALTVGLAALSPNLYVTTRAGIAGILGAPILTRYTVQIDYAARVIRLLDPDAPVTIGAGALVGRGDHRPPSARRDQRYSGDHQTRGRSKSEGRR